MSLFAGALALYRMELRMLLRDTRAVILSVVVPLIFMPIVLGASSRIKETSEKQAAEKTHTYAVASGPLREQAKELLAQAAAARRDRTNSVDNEELPIVFQDEPDAPEALRNGSVDFYVEAVSDQNENAAIILELHYREDRPASSAAVDKTRDILLRHRSDIRHKALTDRGFRISRENIVPVLDADVSTLAERSGSKTGRYLTALVLLFMLVGGGSIAADSIAGEKERGTLETLLSAGAGRAAILTAKLMLILTATLTTTIIQVGNLYLFLGLGLADASADLAVHITPGTALLLFALYLPLSLLVASSLLLTFGLAGSYKEAQIYFLPLTLIGPVLALAPALPGLDLRSVIALVPLVNISVAVREILLGEIDIPMIALAWTTTALAAAGIARFASRILSAERLLLSSDTDTVDPTDGDALFGKRVLRWFAALWALVVLGSIAGSSIGIFRSLVLGQLVFAGAAIVMLRRYKLSLPRALALRPVKPLVWPAVVIGAPCAALVALGLFQLVSPALPLSTESAEDLSKTLFPEGMPMWQLALALAIMPPICEELLFRGALLHGLRRRLGPVGLCLVVGLVFGIFHLALFRLVTTSFLGIVITAVALMTGSVFPGILWHAINNAIPLVAMKYGPALAEPPPWSYAAAAAGLALSLFIIWKSRTPYPDVRRSRPSGE
ncbi:MAG: CPBP family intramembrane metalloprotease [Polyangiaceae bacterium]|nr:CPBP family intramembrane metalloprotease [Polyangiaceae bacterium]